MDSNYLCVSSAKVMMVVQPGERNAFDQRKIELNLLKKYENNVDKLYQESTALRM